MCCGREVKWSEERKRTKQKKPLCEIRQGTTSHVRFLSLLVRTDQILNRHHPSLVESPIFHVQVKGCRSKAVHDENKG